MINSKKLKQNPQERKSLHNLFLNNECILWMLMQEKTSDIGFLYLLFIKTGYCNSVDCRVQ